MRIGKRRITQVCRRSKGWPASLARRPPGSAAGWLLPRLSRALSSWRALPPLRGWRRIGLVERIEVSGSDLAVGAAFQVGVEVFPGPLHECDSAKIRHAFLNTALGNNRME